MKRLLFCLVALIAVVALVVPSYAAEMKINGMNHIRAISRDNYDGNDDVDDNANYVTQRFRMYFSSIASENLKLVYKNEIDIEWGDVGAGAGSRGDGGGLAADTVNLETKNIYVEFMVPDTPVKATLGLQGITLHQGWFFSNDVSAARFDMNFDPITVTAYWAGLYGMNVDNNASDDSWQIVVSGGYKAENMDARLSLGYERGPNEGGGTQFYGSGAGIDYDAAQTDDNDFYLLMGEFGMSFDMVSFNVIAGMNFGEADGTGAATQANRKYEGYMFQAKVNLALDMATLRAQFVYASGDKEGDFDEDFRGMAGMAVDWGSEIMANGYFYDRDARVRQIGGDMYTNGDESPNNLWSVGVGADFKPADNTTISANVLYIAMVEERSVGCDPTVDSCDEDTIGVEVNARLAQKIYPNLTLNLVGAYLFADDGYGDYNPDSWADNSGDDAYQVGIGVDYSF